MTTRHGASPASARRQPTSRRRCASCAGARSPATWTGRTGCFSMRGHAHGAPSDCRVSSARGSSSGSRSSPSATAVNGRGARHSRADLPCHPVTTGSTRPRRGTPCHGAAGTTLRITQGSRSTTHFDPAALALLAQAERGRGDSTAANQAIDAMVLAIRSQPGAWHRAWSLALLDEGRAVPEVLAQSRRDLEDRQDVYAWDLQAWALHRTGDDAGAREAMTHALATGIRDPAGPGARRRHRHRPLTCCPSCCCSCSGSRPSSIRFTPARRHSAIGAMAG